MKKLSAFLYVTECLFICTAVILSLLNIDFEKALGKAACFSVAAAIPDGLSYYSTAMPVDPAASDSPKHDIDVIHDKNETNNTGPTESSTVDETLMGSVIKRSILYASGNVSSGTLYINNNTDAAVDIDAELSAPLSFKVTKDGTAQILIYHTHTTESFMTDEQSYYENKDEPRSTDPERNIVAVGEKIAEQLRNAGYTVIHDTTVHDYPGFTGSYSRSAETVKKVLSENPNIKIAIDVHRDSIASGDGAKVAPVVVVDGREAAQVMLVMGSETGNISGYPNWRENLRLAIQLQNQMVNDYRYLARSILLRSAKYNQNLTTGSILIEMGSDANTFDQAIYSGELVGKSIAAMLDGKGKE